MVSSDSETLLFRKHSEIVSKLKLDVKHLNESWHNFHVNNKNYILEGDPLHWIGCSIYATCWKSSFSSSPSGQSSIQTNFIDLTNLLRCCNLSLAQFFSNIKKWSDMSAMSEDFNRKIDHVENAAAVVYNVFKEYQQLFHKIFKAPELLFDADQAKLQQKIKKAKCVPCTPLKVFEFCWTLFVTIKGEEANYGIDLVSSCHLLIVVCDWAFKNAFLSNRKDLLNPEFKGLPPEWHEANFIATKEPCIINYLCSNDLMVTDIKYIKYYPFKQFIKSLFDKNVLFGKDGQQLDVFDGTVFERNFKNMVDSYEQQFSKRGDFNERIFLADYQRKLLEREQTLSQGSEPAPSLPSDSPREAITGQSCLTPLTGRKFLGPKEVYDLTPFATASENSSKLKVLLQGRKPEPSEVLSQLFQSCANDPTERVKNIETELGEKFLKAYAPEQTDSIIERLQMAKTLFYKLVESILENEKIIRTDISAIVEKDTFYKCTFACSVEIIIYSHGSSKIFPWVLKALNFQAYDFVKIIELIIRLQDQFSRDIIRHLNMIEEIMISSVVWKSESSMWLAIENSGQEIPKFEETALPGHLHNDQNSNAVKKINNSDQKQLQSPTPSATERFQSPVNQSNIVNRQLFPTVQSGQSLLMINYHGVKVIPFVNNETPKQSLLQAQSQQTPQKADVATLRPKRTGSLCIIFRKFYHLAGVRLEQLLNKLGIANTETKQKIWTIFEESVRKNNCELMKDRDLDQLLMCAIYMVGKLSNTDYKFTDIMKQYRSQPQATSEIYRNVLINDKKTEIIDGNSVEQPAKRGDLIEFYNTVMIGKMKEFAEKFVERGNRQNSDILLSPLPCPNKQMLSPGRIYNNIIIKTYESPKLGFGASKTFNYYFSRSPSKDLKDINKAIRSNGVTGKRLLVEGEVDVPNSKRIANRKVQSLIEERRNQNSE